MRDDSERYAFPSHETEAPGMELRDYFAAAALPQAMVAGEDEDEDAIARYAYAVADAMLKARSAPKP